MTDALSNTPEGVDAGVDPIPSADRADAQKAHDAWPKPGEEGFVHPDGTPQSVLQLAQNAQAAADRDKAGSSVHGAPAHGIGADQVGQPNVEATAAVFGQDVADAVAEQLEQGSVTDPATGQEYVGVVPAHLADDSGRHEAVSGEVVGDGSGQPLPDADGTSAPRVDNAGSATS